METLMKKLLLTLLALCPMAAQAQFNLIAENGITEYFTPCFPLFSTASNGADLLSGVTASTTDFKIGLIADTESQMTEFATTADIETISLIGTWVTPTANTDVRFGECDSADMDGYYQIQFHNDHMSKSNVTSLIVRLTDDGGTFGEFWIHIDQNAATVADITGASETAIENKLIQAESTCDSGSTTTCVDAQRTEADNNYWRDSVFCSTSGTTVGQCRAVRSFTASSDTITFDPFTVAIATNTYRIVSGTPGLNQVTSSVFMFEGIADSGSSSTLVDAALTQADFFWNNSTALVVNFSGGPEVRCIRGFTASTDTILVSPAFSQAVATEDYVIIPSLTCRNFP